MNVDELEAEALRLDAKSRARLAERLLVSLDELSEEETAQLWAAEAQRRDAHMDAYPDSSRSAEDVFRDARGPGSSDPKSHLSPNGGTGIE